MILLSDSLNVSCMIGQKLTSNENNQISSWFNQAIPEWGAYTSKVWSSFNQLFFSFRLLFQPISLGNAILRRFHSGHFLAKRHSLGVTDVFFNLGSVKTIFHQA